MALLASIRLMRSGRRRDDAIVGAAVGLAAGSKYDAVAVAVAVVGCPPSPLSGSEGARRFRRLSEWTRDVLATMGSLRNTVGHCWIGMRDRLPPDDAGSRTRLPPIPFLRTLVPLHLYSTGFFPGEKGWSLAFYLRTLNGQGLIFPVLTGVGLLGLFGRWWRESLVSATVVVSYGWLISAQVVYFDRNLIVGLPALVVLAAFGVATIADRIPSLPWARIWVIAGIALIVAGLVPPFVASARLPALLNDASACRSTNLDLPPCPGGIYRRGRGLRAVDRQTEVPPRGRPVSARRARGRFQPRQTRSVLTEMGSGRFLADP